MEYNIHRFINPGFLTYKLTEDEMNFVFKRIEEANGGKVINSRLAGNISTSYDMGLHDLDPILNIVLPLSREYENQFGKPYTETVSGKSTSTISLDDWWVNYQYQNEFNPAHAHSGIYSWVIWIKIPTEYEDQKMLPIALNSNSSTQISNFSFFFTNALGSVTEHTIKMGKASEGIIAFFPAQFKHCVYPFYNCDEPRISVAGNISMHTK
jgi:hypothetical protein